MEDQNVLVRIFWFIFNQYVGASIGSFFVLTWLAKLYFRRKYELVKKSYPKDVVILHQVSRTVHLPSMCPFALKLETWLRMTNIKYQNDDKLSFGPKGKVPYITFNGEDLADSNFCIEFLSKKLEKDLNSKHSPSDQGVARAFSKMTEESLVWFVALQRYSYQPDPMLTGMRWPLLMYFGNIIKNRSIAQGYGLHSKEEGFSIGKKDLKSIEKFLQGKVYLLGDQPCNEDASIFAMICQIIYADKGECPNLIAYTDRIKAKYWPDWNECLAKEWDFSWRKVINVSINMFIASRYQFKKVNN